MKKLMLIGVVVLLALVAPVFFIAPASQCEGYSGQIVANKVLCCCDTWSGGQCCAWVTYCGSFIPGCYCK